MAFPADGVESTYRNNIDGTGHMDSTNFADVAQLLRSKHSDNFMIYNLSERKYDYTKFNNQVHEWCGFPDR